MQTQTLAPVNFLDLGPLHQSIREELHQASQRVIDSGWYVLGPELEAFEQEFAAYCQSQYCIGVGNGLNAITIALKACGVGAGDEVIVPSHTYVGTWLGVSETGATPVPVETNPQTYNLDPNTIEQAISPRTKAIMPVHLYGQPAEMTAINTIAKRHGLWVVTDCAQGHGGQWQGQTVGSLADVAAFSFYPTKNLGALGDGGAVITSNETIANKVKMLRNYGSTKKYVNEITGTNSRLDEMQAAFLRVKLRYLDEWNKRKADIAQSYNQAFKNLPNIVLPFVHPDATSCWHQYVIRHPKRDEFQQKLLDDYHIKTLIHYPTACHHQPCYQEKFNGKHYSIAEEAAATLLSLPTDPMMSPQDIERVIHGVIQTSMALNK